MGITGPNIEALAWVKLAETLGPHLLWITLIVGMLIFVGPGKIAAALLNARKIGFAGIEIQLKEDLAEAAQTKNIELPLQSQDQVTRRIQRLSSFFSGARFLWIDDNSAGNINEIRLLRRLGVIIDLAADDVEAQRHLSGAVYDIVLSDMGRGHAPDAGERFIPEIMRAVAMPTLIFYVGQDRPVPRGALGLTARPDELFNLIMDALERRRG